MCHYCYTCMAMVHSEKPWLDALAQTDISL